MVSSLQKQKGFTLVEMLVSIGLFSVVATMGVGTLLVLIDANARAQSMQLVMTNLSFSIDSMTRELRTGSNWYCDTVNASLLLPAANGVSIGGDDTQDCGSANMISLVESGNNTTGGNTKDDKRISYYFSPDYYKVGQGAILRSLGQGTQTQPLTGSDIDVDQFEMRVSGTDLANTGDREQPRVTIFIKGRADVIAAGSVGSREFSLQTTVVQRLLDV